ncbi:MAG: nuclear transport factor 2 family protein [Rhodococcus sp. (in: high G+C Gram-positive bacteria)]|uniref:nuclear transport factor 2 family protein n=1 Tax=Rhodococcus sp. TaxID=1831 RepID=UPI002ADA916C|nr:nuclear transport factor 2 family protein [Rhodococcus sp. (in: high G+C Gram-positive bacteria)]
MVDRQQVLNLIERWRRAELSGDADVLSDLFGEDFIGVGPMGWVRTRDQWIEKHRSGAVKLTRFELKDLHVVVLGSSASIVIAHQEQIGRNGTAVTTGAFRFSVSVADDARIHSIHVTRIIAPQ